MSYTNYYVFPYRKTENVQEWRAKSSESKRDKVTESKRRVQFALCMPWKNTGVDQMHVHFDNAVYGK